MENHKHKFKLDRQSMVILNKKCVEIDVYKCIVCNKIQIIDKDKSRVISLGGKMGEEADLT